MFTEKHIFLSANASKTTKLVSYFPPKYLCAVSPLHVCVIIDTRFNVEMQTTSQKNVVLPTVRHTRDSEGISEKF